MDLPQRVADRLGIERSQAEQGLSALFVSLRMALDPALFSQVSAAVPESETWMRDIELTGKRTGEIVVLGEPGALGRQLKLTGFNQQQARALGATVVEALGELLPEDVVQKIVSQVPLLEG